MVQEDGMQGAHSRYVLRMNEINYRAYLTGLLACFAPACPGANGDRLVLKGD